MVIHWFRRDLRLVDNPALALAAGEGETVLPVFILDESLFPGGASRWWLRHALAALDAGLRARGGALTLRRGPAAQVLAALMAKTGAGVIFANRVEERVFRAVETGLPLRFAHDQTLFHPGEMRRGDGGTYRVFTPFSAAALRRDVSLPVADFLPAFVPPVAGLALEELLPRPAWAAGFAPWRAPATEEFLDALAEYPARRDDPFGRTSRLSASLHWGEIGIRSLWWRVRERALADPRPGVAGGAEAFLRQLLWREFALGLLAEYPSMDREPLDRRFASFPWLDETEHLMAWREGRTGYPIVDAAMRCLWRSGFLANRLRMVAASFLTKDLLLPWQQGAAWFMETLVDADLANNSFGWQWVAGCGADAAPYFRIFNPVLQGRKFDPEGAFVRTWLPELGKLAPRFIHAPWQAPAAALEEAGIRLGVDYPLPVVDHARQREKALMAYRSLS